MECSEPFSFTNESSRVEKWPVSIDKFRHFLHGETRFHSHEYAGDVLEKIIQGEKELVQIQQFPKRTVYKNSRKGR